MAGPTNGDTLEWLKSLSGEKYSESNLEAAKTFLGFVGDRKMFASWREKFLNKHKSVRQESHRRLMKMCGGGGKHGNIPPKEFIPHNLLVEAGKCGKCDETFESNSDLKIHILNEHNADVKKAYANESWEMIEVDEKYVEWLKKSSLTMETNEAVKMEQLKETNKFLTEKINAQNRNAYIKVKEIGSINEMKREVFKTNEDGTIKTTVVTQQFLDVTTRKRKSTDGNPDQKKSTNTVKNQSKNVENVIRHVAGEGLENQAGLVAKYLDWLFFFCYTKVLCVIIIVQHLYHFSVLKLDPSGVKVFCDWTNTKTHVLSCSGALVGCRRILKIVSYQQNKVFLGSNLKLKSAHLFLQREVL